MLAYIVRRLALMIPTLIGIMVINFAIVQLAPGGPIEQIIAEVTGTDSGTTGRISGGGSEVSGGSSAASASASTADSGYRGAQGLDPEFIKDLERQFGFDKPLHERFLKMMGNFIVFVLAVFVGFQVIWNVSHSLHTPLMAVTNAISSIIILGALMQIGSGSVLVILLAALSVFMAGINIFGGFMVTRRMLAMFQKS